MLKSDAGFLCNVLQLRNRTALADDILDTLRRRRGCRVTALTEGRCEQSAVRGQGEKFEEII